MQFFLDWTWGDINAGDVGPGMFSWFHILSLVLMVIFTVAICKIWGTKHDPKTDRVVVGVFAVLLASIAKFFPTLYNTSEEIQHLATGMILLTALTKGFQSYHMSVFFTIRAGGLIFWTALYDCGFLWLVTNPLTFVLCHYVPLPFLVIYGISLLPEVIKCGFGACLLRKTNWIKTLTLS